MRYIYICAFLFVLTGSAFIQLYKESSNFVALPVETIPNTPIIIPTPSPHPIPVMKLIENNYQVYQTFNNCGPAALSMALSYYGITKNQLELGKKLRPYQNPQGDNDDKSVTLDELAENAQEYSLIPFHRPNGSIELIKQFISYDIPVITRTLLKENDDIGHYRVIKGFDDTRGELIQDDSLQGHNLKYSYGSFKNLWKVFNYEYLVLVPPDKIQIAKNILGDDMDILESWKKAVENSKKELETNPEDINSRFNLSIAFFRIGDFQNALNEFEKIENKLPSRTLWYQIEPIQVYFELEVYQKAFMMIDAIIGNQNKAYSELYIIRGMIYKKQGNIDAARTEFKNAIFYNQNLKSAQQLLQSTE